jgi:trimeric autotransporter adhesin
MKREIKGKQVSVTAIWILLATLPALNSRAQQTGAAVPHLVRFGGMLTDISGKPLTGTVGVTFALYTDQQAGVPLWLEMQNVVADRTGHYSIQLGSTKPDGISTDLFTSGEARWLGVQPEGQAEQPRILLLSVPYALKAGDSETLGGLSASAFVLAALPSSASSNAGATSTSTSTSTANSAPPATNVTGSGTLDFIPLWTGTSNMANSVLFQSGSGTSILHASENRSWHFAPTWVYCA